MFSSSRSHVSCGQPVHIEIFYDSLSCDYICIYICLCWSLIWSAHPESSPARWVYLTSRIWWIFSSPSTSWARLLTKPLVTTLSSSSSLARCLIHCHTWGSNSEMSSSEIIGDGAHSHTQGYQLLSTQIPGGVTKPRQIMIGFKRTRQCNHNVFLPHFLIFYRLVTSVKCKEDFLLLIARRPWITFHLEGTTCFNEASLGWEIQDSFQRNPNKYRKNCLAQMF